MKVQWTWRLWGNRFRRCKEVMIQITLGGRDLIKERNVKKGCFTLRGN